MSWGPKDQHTQAVSQNYWDIVCPESERRIIDADEVMKQLGREPDGIQILTEWTKVIRSMQERCIEIKGTQTFDVYMIGSSHFLSLWNTFKDHPTVRLLEDFEVVKNAVLQNMRKFQSISWAQKFLRPKTGVIEGLLGIRVLRDDFRGEEGQENGHCFNLARWGSTFSGWNQLPQLPDKHVEISRDGVARGDFDYYLKHCLPTPDKINSRIREIRKETSTPQTHIFIASDAEDEFLVDLRRTLEADEWGPNRITTGRDLELNWQATSISNVVDMSILSRAELFIGNGWSSMMSNVVMRRLTTGRSPTSTRHW
ncbi:hypothetical protein OPQ81_011892 [Rhizoctonia solani]|nr:hypothetical protein OPQ81_011892 [Rhizoctonia solani]